MECCSKAKGLSNTGIARRKQYRACLKGPGQAMPVCRHHRPCRIRHSCGPFAPRASRETSYFAVSRTWFGRTRHRVQRRRLCSWCLVCGWHAFRSLRYRHFSPAAHSAVGTVVPFCASPPCARPVLIGEPFVQFPNRGSDLDKSKECRFVSADGEVKRFQKSRHPYSVDRFRVSPSMSWWEEEGDRPKG